LVIKPIKKDDIDSNEENVHDICSLLLKELVNTCVTNVDGEIEELKLPPIIVKIPKASISPKKVAKKDNIKSPKKCIKKLNFTFSKQPSVTIRNLKILPPLPPPVTETILEIANKNEDNCKGKHNKEKKTTLKNSPSKQILSKLQIQTPPPLCVIRNKKKIKSPEVSSEPIAVNYDDDEKESVVTVLKMSEIVSMKQKEENLDRLNDLEKMLELENKLKIEDRRKMKEVKDLAVTTKKKTSKISPKSKQVPVKESNVPKELKLFSNQTKETEIDEKNNLKNKKQSQIKNIVTDEKSSSKLIILAKKNSFKV